MSARASSLVPFAIVDVQYARADRDGVEGAVVACVVAGAWGDAEGIEERTAAIASVLPYKPGAFYERELPCIVHILSILETPVRAVVIDGYVELDADGSPGLGAHLHEHLRAQGRAVTVIGVAKTSFRGAAFATPITRGESKSPLYVTARGMAPADAGSLVQHMHGAHRIPTLLTRVDHLARGLASPRAR